MQKLTSDIQNILESKKVHLCFPQINSNKYAIEKVGTSKCKSACPIDTDVKAYLGFISTKEFDKALEIVKRDNPLPGICGRVCFHPCEAECSRNEIDQPLAICSLKRFLADYELKNERTNILPIQKSREEKIAIIGSGPAGLTTANNLIRLGYKVTIFEKLPVVGGMLYTGIPEYRLPRNIIKTEIDAIEKLGVEIKTNTKIDNLDKLRKEGYNVIFIAIGAHKGLKLGIPGEDKLEGFIDCITFLRTVNLASLRHSETKPKNLKIGKKVIVIGGGNAAIDSARTALRLGSDVHILYRRSREEMPASKWEIKEAEKEGIKIHYLASPVKILGEKGKVVAIKCIKNKLGPSDASGRRRPISIKDSEFKIEADTIIPAISQQPDISWLPTNHKLEISKWNSFVINEETLATNVEGIFAGGDCVTGPKTVIDAIAAGHKASKSIDRYLNPEARSKKQRAKVEFEVVVNPKEKKERILMPELPIDKRSNFKEVELGFTEEMAIEEAKRCLRCGFCAECSECISNCTKKLISLSIQGETSGILLRVPLDTNQFPLNNTLQGKLYGTNSKEIPVTVESITARVISDFCRGCGNCVEICEYSAPKLKENGVQICSIDEALCKGCGVCISVCPSGAITLGHFTDNNINKLMEVALQTD